MNKPTNEQTNEWLDDRANKPMNGWMNDWYAWIFVRFLIIFLAIQEFWKWRSWTSKTGFCRWKGTRFPVRPTCWTTIALNAWIILIPPVVSRASAPPSFHPSKLPIAPSPPPPPPRTTERTVKNPSGSRVVPDACTGPSARSHRSLRSFACSALLASLARCAALIPSHTRSLTHNRARGKVNDYRQDRIIRCAGQLYSPTWKDLLLVIYNYKIKFWKVHSIINGLHRAIFVNRF